MPNELIKPYSSNDSEVTNEIMSILRINKSKFLKEYDPKYCNNLSICFEFKNESTVSVLIKSDEYDYTCHYFEDTELFKAEYKCISLNALKTIIQYLHSDHQKISLLGDYNMFIEMVLSINYVEKQSEVGLFYDDIKINISFDQFNGCERMKRLILDYLKNEFLPEDKIEPTSNATLKLKNN